MERAARETRENLGLWFAIDTLEYLEARRADRRRSAWIGSTLKIKPILSVQSEMVPLERVRTSAKAFDGMVRFAHERHADAADAWVVQHIQSPDRPRAWPTHAARCSATSRSASGEIGPVLGVHAGPGPARASAASRPASWR